MSKELIKITPFEAFDAKAAFILAEESGLSFWSLDDYKTEAERTDSFALTAKKEGMLVGFIISRLITSEALYYTNENPAEITIENKITAGEAEIYNIAVHDAFRGKGIGGNLLEALFYRLAHRHNNVCVWLEVRESNAAAIGFYEKNKFEIYRTRRNFYADPSENALIMRREIKRRDFRK